MNAHERFMELTESEIENRRAQMIYDDEFARKMELDGTAKRLIFQVQCNHE